MSRTVQRQADERRGIELRSLLSASANGFETCFVSLLREKVEGFLRVPAELLAVATHPKVDGFLYGDRIAVFLISGREIRLTLKIHYSRSRCRAILDYKNLPIDEHGDINAESLFSLFAELGNLVAGGLKRELLDLGYIVGISLPIDASAFDEIISSDRLVAGKLYHYSDVRLAPSGGETGGASGEEASFTVSLTVEPTAGDGLERIMAFDFVPGERRRDNPDDEFL